MKNNEESVYILEALMHKLYIGFIFNISIYEYKDKKSGEIEIGLKLITSNKGCFTIVINSKEEYVVGYANGNIVENKKILLYDNLVNYITNTYKEECRKMIKLEIDNVVSLLK